MQITHVYKKGNCARIAFWEKLQQLWCGLKSLPTLVVFLINPKHGPFACGLCSDHCWPTQTWYVVGQPWLHSQAKCHCPSKLSDSSPEVCFSFLLIFAFYVWLVAACLEAWVTERIHHSLLSFSPGQAREWVHGTVLPWLSWRWTLPWSALLGPEHIFSVPHILLFMFLV